MNSKELYAIYRTKEFKHMANFKIHELLSKISDDEFVEFFEKFKKEIGTKSEYKLDDKVLISKVTVLKRPSYYTNQKHYSYIFIIRGARKVVRTEENLIRRLITVDTINVYYNNYDNPKIFKNIDEIKLLNKYLEGLRGDEMIGLNRRDMINLVILKYYNYQND